MINRESVFPIVLCAAVALPTLPGARRHDVSDARYRALAENPAFESVGLLILDGEPDASTVLIAPGLAVTAGHEVADREPSSFQVAFGDSRVRVTEIVLHPSYAAAGLGHGVDLALLRLDTELPSIAPAHLYPGRGEVGKIGVTVGYRRSGAGKSIVTEPTLTGTKRAGTNRIDQVGGQVGEREIPLNLLVGDFDHPAKDGFNRTGPSAITELEFCPVGGDSGGGLFIQVDGDWFLAGIVSAATINIPDEIEDGIYGSINYWVRISDYLDWLTGQDHPDGAGTLALRGRTAAQAPPVIR